MMASSLLDREGRSGFSRVSDGEGSNLHCAEVVIQIQRHRGATWLEGKGDGWPTVNSELEEPLTQFSLEMRAATLRYGASDLSTGRE